ncbi:hypothetical protein Scep_002524 [Stephania cephalantha]|uniref:Dynamin-type G domain-containing protein n=1 Tax=Stephania cephalantha TaxID=152367 RepID=A0AAP0Q521_9MAGN
MGPRNSNQYLHRVNSLSPQKHHHHHKNTRTHAHTRNSLSKTELALTMAEETHDDPRRNSVSEEQWKLYEAYNELHGLAQEFKTPFDAPAVLVVGHQTDGKSALVEGLMGFQFNHVGGGTKTRRPITLHMKYDPDCEAPVCRLVSDADPVVSEEKSLEEIQAYIEAENMRLEREPCQFWDKEIIILVEYKYCPNLTIIDTPGLTAPTPGRRNRALQGQSRSVESLVRAKMQHKEFIILCLEDCSDWSNATTRRVVMQIDPELSRTVVVSTKLDTKIPQFARSSDVEVFLRPPASTLDGCMLGDSPFFTSVPSGRVGSGHESVYRSNDEFKQALSSREMEDIASLEEKLGRPLSKEERSRIGVSSLRTFLEELLQKRYMGSVPSIIPLLEKEHRSTTRKLSDLNQELSNLDEVKLKEKGRIFHDSFLTKLSLLLKGSVVAPPDKFGETLHDERVNGGAFSGTDGLQFPHKLIPEARGSAPHHVVTLSSVLLLLEICEPGTRLVLLNQLDKVSMLMQLGLLENSALVTACVIAVSKARDTFEPFLHQIGKESLVQVDLNEAILLRLAATALVQFNLVASFQELSSHALHTLHYTRKYIYAFGSGSTQYENETLGTRLLHILKRLLPISLYLLQSSLSFQQKDGEYLSAHEVFLRRVANSFDNFAESTERACREKLCMEDLVSTTRYVTWSLHNKNRAGLRQFLDSFAGSEQTVQSASSTTLSQDSSFGSLTNDNKNDVKPRADVKLSHLSSGLDSGACVQTTETRLVDLLDTTLWNRRLAPSSERIVYALVQQIFHGIREYFLASAELKFNCFLLMPVVDKLPVLLREDLEHAFENDLDNVFDITNLRHSLGKQKRDLEVELKRIQRLKVKFRQIHEQLSTIRSA